MLKKINIHKEKLILLTLATGQVLISFFTHLLIVKKIGFGNELDIFYLAMAVFNFLSTSVGWSISSVLTPLLIKNRENNLEGKMFVNVFLITIPILLLMLLSIPFWVDLIFMNYLGVVDYYKIIIIQILLIIAFAVSNLNIVFIAILQEKNKYIKINLLNLMAVIVGLLIAYFFIEEFGLYAAAISQLGVQIFLFLIMLYSKLKIKDLKLEFDRQSLYLLWERLKYLFFGSIYYRMDELVERFIASYFSIGFLSLVGFIQRIYGAIITVLNTSIAGPTITSFSNSIRDKDLRGVKKILYSYLTLLFIIDLAILFIVILVGEDLFLHFFSKNINEQLLPLIFVTITLMSVNLFGSTLGQILHNLLLSMQSEKMLTIADIFTFTLGLILKIIGATLFGMVGFLIAIAISSVIKNLVKGFIVIKNLGF